MLVDPCAERSTHETTYGADCDEDHDEEPVD